MDSLYAHALKFFEDRFMGVSIPAVPSALAPISFLIQAPASVIAPAEHVHGLLEEVWARSVHKLIERHIIPYRCVWAVEQEGGQLFLMVATVTDPEVVRRELAKLAAPEDEHPFADRMPTTEGAAALRHFAKDARGPSIADIVAEAVKLAPPKTGAEVMAEYRDEIDRLRSRVETKPD